MQVDATTDLDRPGGLSEATIVATAMEILAERGVTGLTMRALSSRLGVALGATYNHVRSKHDLLRLVAEELYARIEPGPPDADGFSRARSVMVDVHRLLGAYPGMAAYMGEHLTEFSSPNVAKLVLTPLCEAGLSTADAKRVTLALVLLTAGDLLLHIGDDVDEADGTFTETLDLLLDGARSRAG
ncbi:MAG TPA: TetR family transcriptional regulator [Acidimicrobiales bacterium]